MGCLRICGSDRVDGCGSGNGRGSARENARDHGHDVRGQTLSDRQC